MRMFRSFILRLALILSITASICLFLMTLTLAIQEAQELTTFCGLIFLVVLVWFVFNWFIVRKTDQELSMEVARILFPAGAVLSLCLSVLLSLYLNDLLQSPDGKQHLVIPFVGVGVAIYLVVRSFDIKWLRGEEEITMLEQRDNNK